MNNKITAKSLKVIHEILVQKTNQIFLVIFSIYKKPTNEYYQKHWKKHVKGIRIFLKKKKKKEGPRKISKYFWGTKAEANLVYEKLLFST